MSNEREKLVGVIAKNCQIYDFKANQWLILDIVEFTKDIKHWAKGCVPEERQNFPQRTAGNLIDEGYNQCRAETLKKIEESE
jgi:hypothetical protein